jgi:hypothetical protein
VSRSRISRTAYQLTAAIATAVGILAVALVGAMIIVVA